MAINKTPPSQDFDSLKSVLLHGKVQQQNPALFQFLDNLINKLNTINAQLLTRIVALETLASLINNATLITYQDEHGLTKSKMVINFLLRGARADQPAASSVINGSLYFVTDELVIEQSNGATWDAYSA